VYAGRVRGERRANLERAIAACESALEVYTRADFPQDWALAQLNLGKALVALASAEPAARAEREARGRARYAAALEMFTLDALPHDYRRTQMLVAELEAGRGAWLAAHAAYAAALGAEERLLALSAGASARDAVLREGRETSTRTAFCLAQLGRVDEAVVAAERGRTRGLAEARQVEWADPARIGDRGRRERYIAARDRWVAALAELHRPMAEDAAEEERRAQGLVRAEACRAARGELDAVVAEIRAAGDPADFMDDSLDLATLGRAARTGGVGHTLVYLLATPWGGAALAVHAAGDGQTTGHLPLPELTSERVGALLQLELGDGSGRVVGGFGHAQEGRGLSFLEYGWEGASFAAKAANLHVACAALGIASALDRAAAEIQEYPAVGALAAWPLDRETYAQIDPTLEFVYLEHELRRCLPELGALALGPVAGWLGAAGVGGVTLVPCGALAAFPLLAAPVGGGGIAADGVATVERAWRTLGDMLPSTVVPSARALLAEDGHREEGNATTRYGVMALGDPWPTHQPLEWGEAEARTLAALGGNAEGTAIHEGATREWLLAALRGAEVVDASCHGEFNATDFLRSRLLLANGATLTLGDILGGASDLRGLRLLILSACQTAILDLRGASDEVRSLAAGMLQAGARAVLGALWSVDDRATYLLMTRFAQEWLPRRHAEPPAGALARAQRWLRTVTAAELRSWQVSVPDVATMPVPDVATMPVPDVATMPVALASAGAVRGRGMRYAPGEAGERVAAGAELLDDNACPYADPIYWSAFQISGW
jgi:CHAT domain-containing protein/tetratricopeptide (TPR) repeat protein